jgi:hypothetical protein
MKLISKLKRLVAVAIACSLAFTPALAADLTVTAASVVKGTGAKTIPGIAGETVTAGQTAYRDPTTKKFSKADANGASALREVAGIFLNSASANQSVHVQTSGPITIGATVTVGTVYVNSDTAGGIMPAADLSAGDYTSVIGVGISATQIQMGILNSGVAVP